MSSRIILFLVAGLAIALIAVACGDEFDASLIEAEAGKCYDLPPLEEGVTELKEVSCMVPGALLLSQKVLIEGNDGYPGESRVTALALASCPESNPVLPDQEAWENGLVHILCFDVPTADFIADLPCPTPNLSEDPASFGEWMTCEMARCPGTDVIEALAGGFEPLC